MLRRSIACLALILATLHDSSLLAVPAEGDSPLSVQLGFDGKVKIGHISPLRVALDDSLASQARGIRVSSVDGDGVEVVYHKDLSESPDSVQWLPIRVGRKSTPIRVSILDATEAMLAATEVGVEAYEALSADQPFVLAIGSSLGIEDLNRLSADRTESNFSYAILNDADSLSPFARDYISCDLVLVSARDTDLIRSIGKPLRAIQSWVERGGGCVVSLAEPVTQMLQELSAEEARASEETGSAEPDGIEALSRLLPDSIQGWAKISNPGVLESLVATEEPLSPFSAALIGDVGVRVDVAMTDSLSRSTAWLTTKAVGQGTVRCVASDLEDEAFGQWQDRKLLWEFIVDPYLSSRLLERVATEEQNRDSSYLGYSDLVGQLRAALDVFAGVREVAFSQVVAILIGVLLIIGPLDYFISVRWLQRPDFSWYFTTAVLLLASMGLAWYCGQVRPKEVLVNSVQIVDIDTTSGKAKGSLWSHVYSGSARRVNIGAKQVEDDQWIALDWQGLPGNGLGGLNAQLATDRGMPAYQIRLLEDQATRLEGVGIAAGGTKCLFGSWESELELDESFELSELRGVDQLTGDFKNPFDVDIRDAVLFYHNWYYRLNSRIPAGERVVISSDTIPKDIGRKLNERTVVDEKVSGRKWDPSNRGSVDRLLELMMFHKAASGSNYTSLTHRYQPFVDHSNLLTTDLAFLICRFDQPLASISVDSGDGEGDSLEVKQEMDRVWCRLTIPVSK